MRLADIDRDTEATFFRCLHDEAPENRQIGPGSWPRGGGVKLPSRRTGCLLGLAALVLGLGITLAVLIHMAARPGTFFLAEPNSDASRRAFLAGLQANLKSIEEADSRDSTHSGANDPDLCFPKDRTLIAIAVQQFRLKTGRLPQSMSELQQCDAVATTTLPLDYRLVLQGDKWEAARSGTGMRIAVGN